MRPFSQLRRSALLALVVSTAAAGIALSVPAGSRAAANPQEMLIYMPYGLIHAAHPASQLDGYLDELGAYQIDQVLFAMPKFKPSSGIAKLPRHNREMLRLWIDREAAYNAAHHSEMGLTMVFNAKVKTNKNGLDLESPAVRANMIASIEATLALGISGVQLDLEPYPVTPGFVALLEELDGAFARLGFRGRFSVTAPATTSRWSPAYLKQVSGLVTQVDPLYYDSESKTVGAYQSWAEASLAYYSANVSPATSIVPVLPSYSANRWHLPSVENITTATSAVSRALDSGARIGGAGIWSGWGFLLDEEGAYDASSDRAIWQSSTVELPFAP
jgi:hypothetical protein